MPTNRVSGNQAGGPEVDGRGWGQPSGMILMTLFPNSITALLLLTLAWL